MHCVHVNVFSSFLVVKNLNANMRDHSKHMSFPEILVVFVHLCVHYQAYSLKTNPLYVQISSILSED